MHETPYLQWKCVFREPTQHFTPLQLFQGYRQGQGRRQQRSSLFKRLGLKVLFDRYKFTQPPEFASSISTRKASHRAIGPLGGPLFFNWVTDKGIHYRSSVLQSSSTFPQTQPMQRHHNDNYENLLYSVFIQLRKRRTGHEVAVKRKPYLNLTVQETV